jgi:hypothetical protein
VEPVDPLVLDPVLPEPMLPELMPDPLPLPMVADVLEPEPVDAPIPELLELPLFFLDFFLCWVELWLLVEPEFDIEPVALVEPPVVPWLDEPVCAMAGRAKASDKAPAIKSVFLIGSLSIWVRPPKPKRSRRTFDPRNCH